MKYPSYNYYSLDKEPRWMKVHHQEFVVVALIHPFNQLKQHLFGGNDAPLLNLDCELVPP